MLKAITDTVVENLGKDHDEVETYVKEHFNSTTDNIFTYVKCVIIKNSKQLKTLTENRCDPLKAP